MSFPHRPEIRSKTTIDDFVQELKVANESFISIGKQLPELSEVNGLHQEFRQASDRLLSMYRQEVKRLHKKAVFFLHILDDRKHDEDIVKKLIKTFPSALRLSDDILFRPGSGCVPVQSLMYHCAHGYSFVPLLVKEGMRLGLFSGEEKGGLNFHNAMIGWQIPQLLVSSDGRRFLCEGLGINRIQFDGRLRNQNDTEFHTLFQEINIRHDEKSAHILKKLFEMNVLGKDDIIKCELIKFASLHGHSKKRLELLLSLHPECLAGDAGIFGSIPVFDNAHSGDAGGFCRLLKAGLKYYPRKLGYLLHRNYYYDRGYGKSPIDVAMTEKFIGKKTIPVCLPPDDIFKWIHEVIPPSDDQPILHDVIRLSPKHFSLFWKYYPDAVHLRDNKGRLPLHIALQRAAKWSQPLLSLILANDPIDRHETDPVTGLCPFMSAASGRSNDLNVIYYLLRRDPSVWEGFDANP